MLGFIANLFSQTIVGTDPENKNVVLEEFTGIHCVYCPDGHAIAQAIYDQHPNDVVLINIHTGSFASPGAGEPDYRTQWGSAIAGQSGLTGYPAGTVNRHLFSGWSQGSGTAMSRNYWSPAANIVFDEASYLNVALEATIIPATRQLSVLVEVYYTGDSPESVNLLNVAILQSNIFGPQTGGGAGDNYNHKHMLRHLLTGQWGVEISETTEGSFFTTTIN
ncbi:MAG: Omp28-related outer membrane protein, partial [Bacteroidales bacterium]|nr:Omp28-related outer membrane protein [Bacteroidales bacterium]